ncbi:ABC transporter permease [Psychrobium sp. 1_MG-2023]|uniref:ABC transporter permease n=1 Tax=Psychrobium sp. 1_MG-2023 TaxID=3062624 RepID=UPI000C322180|nr:ABC transporter permease [Psychrobium sp. 1_MG-2023]MDP2559765.1 FtsX-like permease family protein [Psychrobium sp. 1_MG-2023]PKF59127.1 ABC transporter permease [Alteromonadales bacterium alter-6D02]
MLLSALNKKLVRDMMRMKGQLLAIGVVIAAGVAVFVMAFGVLSSLTLSRDNYYQQYQFADIFSVLKRAPHSLSSLIRDIEGIEVVDVRIVFPITVPLENVTEPISGKVVSLPQVDGHHLNQLHLRQGRMLTSDDPQGILVEESFFNAHQLGLGQKIPIMLNGHKLLFTIVGTVLSPEYIYSIAPGAMMPDSFRYGVFWLNKPVLAAAVDMRGAFNDVVIKVKPQSNIKSIQASLDSLLAPYGGLISYPRSEQLSNFFIDNELKQLRSLGMVAPFIFLGVAAFIINVVMSREITMQREQIGMLKAIGYRNSQIVWHFLTLVLVVVSLGGLLGLAIGYRLAVGMTKMYGDFFHFPQLHFQFSLNIAVFALSICIIAGVCGALMAIKQASKLPPAQAMRPPSPMDYRKTYLEYLGVHRFLSFLSRIVLRQAERQAVKFLLSTLGVAVAVAVLIFSFFMEDSIDYLLDVQYEQTQREDINLSLIKPVNYQAMETVKALTGVLKVEPIHRVNVRFRYGHYQKKGVISGLVAQPQLARVVDQSLQAKPIPNNGVLLNGKLAELLAIDVGQSLIIERLDGKRQQFALTVVAINHDYMGLGAYIDIDALNRLLDQPPLLNAMALMIDHNNSSQLYEQLKQIPQVIGVNIVSVLKQIFEQLIADNLLKMVSINIIFAGVISFGVIYNTARIALSERGRELITLRVLGFRRGEVAYILFGELALVCLFALPLGCAIGFSLVAGMISSLDSELFRIPFVIEASTYATAIVIVIISAVLSSYIVWRDVEKIDLVSAQKGVE